MRIFLTGATGFIGTAVVEELVRAGHHVLGLTRSDDGAAILAAAGAEPHRGDLTDLDSLRAGAARSEGVIHTAFDHDFSRFMENCEKDRRAIRAMGEVLAGSPRLLVITSGVGLGGGRPGVLASEDVFDEAHANPRIASELEGRDAAAAGTRVCVMRLPQVHDTRRQGLITPLVAIANASGVSAYVGEGANRWAAAPLGAVARLYRLAIEKGEATRYNAVAQEGVPVRDIAETIGRGLGVPAASMDADAAAAHFGIFGRFVGAEMSASSALTRERLGWEPTGPDLLSDLAAMRYPTRPAA